VAHIVQNLTHPYGDLEFNPTAKPGDADYGLLYTSGSDLGFSNGGGPHANNPWQTQRLDSVITAILRFDPRSPSVTKGVKGLGDYTIPANNRFQADGDPKTLGEIYAYGFRNAHRLTWDTDGTLFAADIGMNQIEEINIVHDGGNYGWMKREGVWENGMTRPGGCRQRLHRYRRSSCIPATAAATASMCRCAISSKQPTACSSPIRIDASRDGEYAMTEGLARNLRVVDLMQRTGVSSVNHSPSREPSCLALGFGAMRTAGGFKERYL
jgi:hypothetical protein